MEKKMNRNQVWTINALRSSNASLKANGGVSGLAPVKEIIARTDALILSVVYMDDPSVKTLAKSLSDGGFATFAEALIKRTAKGSE